MSIKPEYVEKIFSGEKDYEFRKKQFRYNVSTIVVYSSSPVKRIVGEFDIESILEGDLETLWEMTKDKAGISKEVFFNYFSGKITGIAIKIGERRKYTEAIDPYITDSNFTPPQSFQYITC